MARRRKWEGWTSQQIAQARSQSAKKGWLTRRSNYIKAGRMTVAEFEEIYGTSIGELNNVFDEFTEFEGRFRVNPNTGEVIDVGYEYEEPDPYDESQYQDWDRDDYGYQAEYDTEYPDIQDISDDFIVERVTGLTNTTNLAQAAMTELQRFKSEDSEGYYRAVQNNQDAIQTILDNGDLDYNSYESSVLLGDLLQIISRGAISSKEFQLKYKQAKRDDAFNMYHKKHPNAKYGKRRSGGGFYPT